VDPERTASEFDAYYLEGCWGRFVGEEAFVLQDENENRRRSNANFILAGKVVH